MFQNQNESDETIEKIEQYIRELIPKNYFEVNIYINTKYFIYHYLIYSHHQFIQNFYNLVYYEIQLSNVEKELESRKIVI